MDAQTIQFDTIGKWALRGFVIGYLIVVLCCFGTWLFSRLGWISWRYGEVAAIILFVAGGPVIYVVVMPLSELLAELGPSGNFTVDTLVIFTAMALILGGLQWWIVGKLLIICLHWLLGSQIKVQKERGKGASQIMDDNEIGKR